MDRDLKAKLCTNYPDTKPEVSCGAYRNAVLIEKITKVIAVEN
jgi:hypothetical protein